MKKILLLTLLLLFSCSKEDNTALIDSYVSQISSLNSQITLLNSQITNLQAEVTNLRNNPVVVTETVVVQDNSAIQSLTNQNVSLQNTIQQLNYDLSVYQTQVTILQAQISELENNPVVVTETVVVQDNSTVEALQAQISELENTITNLQAQISELENNPVTETVTVTETVIVTTTPTTPTRVEHGVDGGITKIFSDETWNAESIHIIRGKVVVMNGARLTIEPGTIIKAGEGQLADATALVISRGGQINANGTYDKPIIMTDINDNISLTSASTNRTSSDRGLWGGLVILGRAKISNSSPEKAVEGIGISGEIWDYYGGDNNSDSSGVLNYVSIRHTGAEVAPDEEIQGLTLGGVGAGTSIKNIEILGADDDGVEFFGGSVNIENIVIVNANDDSIDVDMAYSGTISNAVIELGYDSDGAFEMDGSKVASYRSKNLITGLTIYGRYSQTATDSDQLGKVRENFQGTVTDVHVFGDALESSSFETFTNMDGTYNFNSYQHTFGTTVGGSEDVIFSDWYFNGQFTQSTITRNASSVTGFNIDSVFPFWATIGTSPSVNQGADESFFGWTVWFQEIN